HLDEAGRADSDAVATSTAFMLRAQAEEKRGELKEAMLAYLQVLKLEPDSEDALAALVRLSFAAGDKGETLDYLRRYTVAVGHDAEGLAQAAEWHLQLDRFEDAFDLASRSRDQKFSARAQRVLGLIYLHREDYLKAAAHLEKADLDSD